MTTRQALGAYGEALAAKYLVQRGMELLDHNWHGDGGEIDLVLRDGKAVVICEVKTRRSTSHGAPIAAVGQRKLATMRRLAAQWMSSRGEHAEEIRLDLVGVLAPYGRAPQIEHVAGVG